MCSSDLAFPVLARTVFPYSHGFCLFSVLARMISFFDPHTYSTLFRYSPRLIFDTHTDSAIFRYPPGFNDFSALTLIRPIFGIRPDSFSTLARILSFFSTCQDDIFFRSSHLFDAFSVLNLTVFRYSHGFCHFLVLARILSFFSTHTYSTHFQYSP